MLKKLSELLPGQTAVIAQLDETPYRSKMIEMGCYPGEEVKVSKIAPMGCPIAIYISGYELSLRKNEADHIMVETNA